MATQASILALRPHAKLSRADRAALKEAGIIVVHVAPEDLVPLQGAEVLPGNVMLRAALESIQDAKLGAYQDDLRANFAKRLIAAYLALGEDKALSSSPVQRERGER